MCYRSILHGVLERITFYPKPGTTKICLWPAGRAAFLSAEVGIKWLRSPGEHPWLLGTDAGSVFQTQF